MSIERSHGKARPTLVRSSDLRPPETDQKPTDVRGPHGHFGPGNRTAVEARLKHTLRKCMGDRAADGDPGIVASDASRVFSHTIRAFPSDAAPVRTLVAIHARHVALHGYYTKLAEVAGLDTTEGLKYLEVADRQSQRAERVLVSAQDMARSCVERAAKKRSPIDAIVPWLAKVEDDNA